MKDNFTTNLSGYYGYRRMNTSVAELLIEFGEISCPEQDTWLQPRLEWMGSVVAHFVGRVLNVSIPKPAEFGDAPPVSRQVQVDPWDADLEILRLELAELRNALAEPTGRVSGEDAGSAPPGTDDDA